MTDKYLPLNLPAGFRDHGTDSDSIGRWRDGSLVRWESGSLRAIGGWRPMDSASPELRVNLPPAEIGRATHGWLTNSGAPYLGIGTDNKLLALPLTLALVDITPAGFTVTVEGENLGYGGKAYGMSTYGSQRVPDGVEQPRSVWSLDNWGEELIACSSLDQRIWHWNLLTPTAELLPPQPAVGSFPAQDPADIPTATAIVVTAERFIFALGADGNPRLVRWCDRENYGWWDAYPENEAGDMELVTEGAIQCGCRVRGRTLILTTYDAHVATYQGPPTVYGFQRIGRGCGISAPLSLVDASVGAYWMGSDSFYFYDGSQVVEIPCDVQDHVFQNINREMIRKAWGVSNERAGEVWWFYPSAGSLECDTYVAYDYEENHWLVGKLNRSTGTDSGPYFRPVWIDWTDGLLYYHETSVNHGGAQPWIESGPIQLGDGDNVLHANQLIQDEKVMGHVEIAFTTEFWPDRATVWEHGPYQMGNPTDVRFTGRQARMKIIAKDAVNWRISGLRLAVTEGGRR